MKLIMAVVSRSDSKPVTTELMRNGFQVTKLASTGGYLTKGNDTLLVGVRMERLEMALSVIKNSCRSRKFPAMQLPVETRQDNSSLSGIEEITVGGATVFVMDVERFEKF